MDNLTPDDRRHAMQQVKSKNTAPELFIRKMVHGMGYRYRLHRRDLPGSPDLVFPARKAVIFVNGCFWHAHNCRAGQNVPASNRSYWQAKRQRNRARDQRVRRELRTLGWRSLVIWECSLRTRNAAALERTIAQFLDGSS